VIISWMFGLTRCRSSDGPVRIISSSSVMKTASALAAACTFYCIFFKQFVSIKLFVEAVLNTHTITVVHTLVFAYPAHFSRAT